MPVNNSFTELIGEIISTFGSIELIINITIRSLATDKILADAVTRLEFRRRLGILRDLMLARMNVSEDEVKEVLGELRDVAEQRNLIAHNPIISDMDDTKRILIVRDLFNTFTLDTALNREDLEKIFERTDKAYTSFRRLVSKERR